MEFASKELILAIASYPELWDPSISKQKQYKSERQNAWVEICQTLFRDFNRQKPEEKELMSKCRRIVHNNLN